MRFSLLLASLLCASASMAQGGPPMLTDDPGTPPIGHFELNFVYTSSQTLTSIVRGIPFVDLAYGAKSNLQLKIEAPWVLARESGDSIRDLGPASVGVKWRFVDEGKGRPSISTFPQVQTAILRRSVREGLADSGTGLLLPIQVQWHQGSLGYNADAGLQLLNGAGPGWLGGIAISKMAAEKTEVILELHGSGDFEAGSHDVLAQVGIRREMSPSSLFIAAFGRSVHVTNAEVTRLNAYVGIQFHF